MLYIIPEKLLKLCTATFFCQRGSHEGKELKNTLLLVLLLPTCVLSSNNNPYDAPELRDAIKQRRFNFEFWLGLDDMGGENPYTPSARKKREQRLLDAKYSQCLKARLENNPQAIIETGCTDEFMRLMRAVKELRK